MRQDPYAHIPRHKEMGCSAVGEDGETAPVVIVGGGPVGLTVALDLGQRGHRVLVLNKLDFISSGSKAICFSKRTLDIWNRLGVAKRMISKGVTWNVGKVFRGARKEPIFQFDVLPIKDQEMPGFINIQQYWTEEYLVDALSALDNVEIRWGHEVTDIEPRSNTLFVTNRERVYTLVSDWIIACDGSKSTTRNLLGLDFEGRVFEDNFLIADVKFEEERPSERWFWFDPPWGGASALLHKQPDNVWRLDFQLGWDIDREAAVKPENVEPYVRGLIGDKTPFQEEWYSIYTFQCRRMSRFVHDRIIFVGDSAHLVSPFGARGCNGGVADADNLAWKLDLVLRGRSGPSLLETYNEEACLTADENILNSSRSTDFMTPKSNVSKAFRDAVLDLAETHSFARQLVNSGRLSTPVAYPSSPLITGDRDEWVSGIAPGSVAIDARLGDDWLLQKLGGDWCLLSAKAIYGAPLRVVVVEEELARKRYELEEDSVYLIRPDQYVAARWKNFQLKDLEASSWNT